MFGPHGESGPPGLKGVNGYKGSEGPPGFKGDRGLVGQIGDKGRRVGICCVLFTAVLCSCSVHTLLQNVECWKVVSFNKNGWEVPSLSICRIV